MSRTLSVCALILLLALGAAAQTKRRAATNARGGTGKIIGVVLDKYEARVTNAAIRIGGHKFKRELVSDEDGEFEVELPAGDYHITVEANGFRKFELPTRKVRPGVSEAINVHLEVIVFKHAEPYEAPASLTTAPAEPPGKPAPPKP